MRKRRRYPRPRRRSGPHAPQQDNPANLLLIPVHVIPVEIFPVGPRDAVESYRPDLARVVALLAQLPPCRPVVLCGRVGEPGRLPPHKRYELADCHVCGASVWLSRAIADRAGMLPDGSRAEPLAVCHQHVEPEPTPGEV